MCLSLAPFTSQVMLPTYINENLVPQALNFSPILMGGYIALVYFIYEKDRDGENQIKIEII